MHRAARVVGIDPNNGKWERICEGVDSYDIRVSPDRETVAFFTLDTGVWTCATQQDSTPGRIFDRGHRTAWSPDGKQMLVTDGKLADKRAIFETWRMNANGTDAFKLAIPETDLVDDWSPDGKWLATLSYQPEPKRGLYVMKPDGTQAKGRWRALIYGGDYGAVSMFGDAIYENEYRKVNGKWMISKLHAWFVFYTELEKGWGVRAWPNSRSRP